MGASWFGFFSTFFSTFAAAPLAKFIKSGLKLTKDDLYLGNITSVAGTILARLVMGTVCDVMGARKGLAFCLFLTSPFILGIMFVTNATGFIACRLFIGCGLASFVACQVGCTQQFSKKIVGLANATAGGWGNLGGGVTNLTMVFIFQGFLAATDDENLSWRLCFLVPLVLHIAAGLMALSGRDLPDGNFKELEASGAKQKSNSGVVLKVGASNVNAWILTITYGFCFGVELTMTTWPPPSSAWLTSARARWAACGPMRPAPSSACVAASGLSGSGSRSRAPYVSSWLSSLWATTRPRTASRSSTVGPRWGRRGRTRTAAGRTRMARGPHWKRPSGSTARSSRPSPRRNIRSCRAAPSLSS